MTSKAPGGIHHVDDRLSLQVGLAARYASHRRPVTIVSHDDNLHANGAKLRLRAVSRIRGAEQAGAKASLAAGQCGSIRRPWWTASRPSCHRPQSRSASRGGPGRRSMTLLACSASLIANGSSRTALPVLGPQAWERGGAQIVADVTDYGRIKLHVLNTCQQRPSPYPRPAARLLFRPRGHGGCWNPAQSLEALVSTGNRTCAWHRLPWRITGRRCDRDSKIR